jgi:hypothetical protein
VDIPLTSNEPCGPIDEVLPAAGSVLSQCRSVAGVPTCVDEFPSGLSFDCANLDGNEEDCRIESMVGRRCSWSATDSKCVARNDVGGCCDDGKPGTLADQIKAVSGSVVECRGKRWDDGNPCTRDSEENGVIVHVPLIESLVGLPGCPDLENCQLFIPCDDGNHCTMLDHCSGPDGLTCEGSPTSGTPSPIFSPDGCSALMCDGQGRSWYLPREGAECHSGDPCEYPGRCDASGTCVGGGPVVCDDDDPCTVSETCDPENGCSSQPAVDGTPCFDGLGCTVNDECVSGSCQSGSPMDCDDADPGTLDHCDLATDQCVHRFPTSTDDVFADARVDFDGLIVPTVAGSVKLHLAGTPDYLTVATMGWCPAAVVAAMLNDDVPECGLGGPGDGDCGTGLAPSCLLFSDDICPAGNCPAPGQHVINRFAGRGPLPGATFESSLLAVNARQLFGGGLDSTPLEATLSLWFSLDQVYGTHGLGRVTLLDTNASGDGASLPAREWRIRVEIGHEQHGHADDNDDETDVVRPADPKQRARHRRQVNVWFAYGGDPGGAPTARRLLQLPIADWTNRSWHSVSVVMRENELCLVLDGAQTNCTSRPADFLPAEEMPDYVYLMGSARPEREGIEWTGDRTVRLERFDVFRRALSNNELARSFAMRVEEGPVIRSGNLEIALTGKHDGYSIRSISDRRTGEKLTTTAPPRTLWQVRLTPRHDVHTGLYDPSPELKAQGTPGKYSPAFDNHSSGGDAAFQTPRRDSTIASPWSLLLDNLSVAVPDFPDVTTIIDPDGSEHVYIQYFDVPLPAPTFFDNPSDHSASDINIPPLVQDPVSGAGNDDYDCEGPGCPDPGRLETVVVHLWTQPNSSELRGQIMVDLESEYWSLAETAFPVLGGLSHFGTSTSPSARLVVPDNNIGRDVPVALGIAGCFDCAVCEAAPWSCANAQTHSVDEAGACVGCGFPDENVGRFGGSKQARIYPSRHMSMPFLGLYDSNSEIGGLFVAVSGGAGRLSHFPIRRMLSVQTGASALTASIVAPPEPNLVVSVVDMTEGAGEPGNDTTFEAWEDHVVTIGLQDGNWYDMASAYRRIVAAAPWFGAPLALRNDVPRWMAQAGYYSTATSRDNPVNETNKLAQAGLPTDLSFTEFRWWHRADAISNFLNDESNGNDSPFFVDTDDFVTGDYDFRRWAHGSADQRRFPSSGFRSTLQTSGASPSAKWVRGGPMALYTNPALVDLGREWAAAPGLVPVFSRGTTWWPVAEASLLTGNPNNADERIRVEFGDPVAPLAFFSASLGSVTHKGGQSGTLPPGVGATPIATPPLDFAGALLLQKLPEDEPPVSPKHDLYLVDPTAADLDEPAPRPDYRTESCKVNHDQHYGCPGHPTFRSTVTSRLISMGALPTDPNHSYPVQGLYIDQVGTVAPRRCDSHEHDVPGGHRAGGGSYWSDGWRDVLSSVRSGIRAVRPDAGLYGEGFNEVLVGVQDGFLVMHDAGKDVVPLAQVVFHDRAQFIGRYTEPTALSAAMLDVVTSQSQTFAYGTMAGAVQGVGTGPGTQTQTYIRHLGLWRRLYPDASVYGRMERPPRLEQLGAAVASDGCGLATRGTTAGVSVSALPTGSVSVPLDEETRFIKAKDTVDLNVLLPMAIAGSFSTRRGETIIRLASVDDNQSRSVIVTVMAPDEGTPPPSIGVRMRGIGVPGAYGLESGSPVTIPVVDGAASMVVVLPACGLVELELLTAGAP